jgi:hypothetical protein
MADGKVGIAVIDASTEIVAAELKFWFLICARRRQRSEGHISARQQASVERRFAE